MLKVKGKRKKTWRDKRWKKENEEVEKGMMHDAVKGGRGAGGGGGGGGGRGCTRLIRTAGTS
jgi:hypothetical protein